MPRLLALLAACAADVNPTDTRLATIPADVIFKPDGPQWHVAHTDAVFRPDGRQVAYPAGKGDTRFILFGNEKGPDFDKVFSPIYSADGRAGPDCGEAGPPVFSSDSRKLAYAARLGGRWHCIIDGVKGKDHDLVRGVALRPDGREVAYWAREGVDGPNFVIKGEWQSPIHPQVVWGPLYSPDGSRVLFAVRTPEGRDRIQIMDDSRGEFDEVWEPRFIDGGRKVAFGARQGRDLWWKVVRIPE